jgi:hypothetical protein
MAEGFTPVSGSVSLSSLTTQFHGYAAIQTGDGDEMEYVFPLAAGTYDMRVITRNGTSHGITDFYVDGVEIHSEDLYAPSTVNNLMITKSGIVITASGLHTISMKTDGKNVSSSDYARHVTSVRFTPE